MRRLRLWPASLAGRLVVLLVATLAIAQLLLVLALRSQQDAVIRSIARSQALSQTVTLARLLDTYPRAEGPRLVGAFRSREVCAALSATPPAPRAMTPTESNLAELLARMLHGVRAGPPQVAVAPAAGRTPACPDTDERAEAPPWARGPAEDGAVDVPARQTPPENIHGASVALTVPLTDQRWLTLNATVRLPHGWDRATLPSFVLSALALALVSVVAVRVQTRGLRALAAASERLGRGEPAPPLDGNGPSEVAAATRAFNTMQQRLSQFMRDRMRLLAGISHDLRTPLTTLRLKAEFVEDPAVRDDIVATIDELTAICEATLAFTRAEAASEATGPLDLAALCAELAGEFTLAGANVAADVEAAPGPPALVSGRPVALKRALRNLVENAVRYGGRARLSLSHQPGGMIALRVDDDGPGLPADQTEEAFKPFVRLEASRSGETGGIGLGLAIARSIVTAHGGELSLANRPEGGLRATILLPTLRPGAVP